MFESGEMTLSHVSMIQKASRRKPAGMGPGAGVAAKDLKKKAVDAISKKAHAQTEKLASEIFELPIVDKTIVKIQANGSVRMEITFTKEQFEVLQQARENLSHQVPDGDLAKVITKLSQQKVAGRRQTLRPQKKITQMRAATMAAVAVKNTEQPLSKNNKQLNPSNKTLTSKVKKFILQRDQVCQYRSPITGKICGSRWHLQMYYMHPRWAGGNHDPQNLQVLCGQHNRMKYKKEAGVKSHFYF